MEREGEGRGLHVCKVGRTQQAAVKLACYTLVNAATNTRQQDIAGFHADIWFSSRILHKTLRCKEVNDDLSVAMDSDPQAFVIPVP